MKYFKGNLPQLSIKYKTGTQKKFKVCSSKDCYEGLLEMFDSDTIEYAEEFIIILLNHANNTIGWVRTSFGGINQTLVDPRTIFTYALKTGATSIILAHNHPSGALKPSRQDIAMTNKLTKGADILSLKILDHLIVTSNGYFSFKDEGMID